MLHGKKYREAAETVDRNALYSPAEAIRLAKSTTTVKFDPTVEVAAQGRPDGPRHRQPAARHR
jgi:large subunit ribosomal protein L1